MHLHVPNSTRIDKDVVRMQYFLRGPVGIDINPWNAFGHTGLDSVGASGDGSLKRQQRVLGVFVFVAAVEVSSRVYKFELLSYPRWAIACVRATGSSTTENQPSPASSAVSLSKSM